MKQPLIAGNWKMYKTIREATELVSKLKKNLKDVHYCEIVVCPPFTTIAKISEIITDTNIGLGAQNCYFHQQGAFTGEISPVFLKDCNCRYVIIGHSERKQYFNETDEIVNKKMLKVFECGLIPIVCVGETLQERETNVTFEVVEKQIKTGLKGLDSTQSHLLVIAYEPIWAIGTGKTATSHQAEEVHKFIRKLYSEIYGSPASENIRIIYGGSVKPENITELMEQPNIDGGLVGGASLDADSFTKIVSYKSRVAENI